MEEPKCYVFKPEAEEERPAKRRRVSEVAPSEPTWEPRRKIYRELWARQEQRIQTVLEESNASSIESIVNFVRECAHRDDPEEDDEPAIPAGLLITGPSIASHAPFYEQLGREISDESLSSRFVVLTSAECNNFKTLLKVLIQKATSINDEGDHDDDVYTSANGSRLLNYDLAILQQWMQKQQVKQVVIAIQDSEAFDSSLLLELIEQLSLWSDRISSVLLFGIGTSAESFQERMPGAALRYLDSRQFDVTNAGEIFEKVFWSMVEGDEMCLRLGPALSNRLLALHRDYLQSVTFFSSFLKYAYMSHFYANILSIFLGKDLRREAVSAETLEALRNLPSFQTYAENLLDCGHAEEVRNLLESDDYLFKQAVSSVQHGIEIVSRLGKAVNFFCTLRESIPRLSPIPRSMLYAQSMAGNLRGSPTVREVLLSLKKASSDVLSTILTRLSSLDLSENPIDLPSFQQTLTTLLASQEAGRAPLRSEHDLVHTSVRATVVAQKVELSKQKAALSKQDAAYSQLASSFHDAAEKYLTEAFVRPQDLFMHEVFLYDLRSPHGEAFTPRPRFAIERALSSPHDYLNCTCCAPEHAGGEGTLSATQPATAILYQLYLESGALINVSDLQSAFNAIIGDDESGGEESEAIRTMLFQRALAELKYLGFVKPSRKKTDHIAKAMWKGL